MKSLVDFLHLLVEGLFFMGDKAVTVCKLCSCQVLKCNNAPSENMHRNDCFAMYFVLKAVT